MRLRDAVRPDPGEPQLIVGRVKAQPNSLDEGVMVIVDDFDQRFEWGPYEWRARGTAWPSNGDPVLLARVGPQKFLVDWWPR